MAAWLIGHITVRDSEKWQEYLGQVGATVHDFGGEVVFRGSLADPVCGPAPGQLIVAIRFADLASLRKWHVSPAYQRLIPIRMAAADVVLSAYQE